MTDDNARHPKTASRAAQTAAHSGSGERLAAAALSRERRDPELREDNVRELRKYDYERLTGLADNIADSAELSIADVIGDVYLAEVDRDVRELDDVEKAIARLRAGKYGLCVDCGTPVDPLRLQATPHAARCVPCQEKVEQRLRDSRRSGTI
jgi:RNA polymerase-binding transcription factor DksA